MRALHEALARRAENGFTVIELVVAMAVVAVLAAVAVPMVHGARVRAEDAVARSHLRAGSKAAFVYAVQTGHFDDTPDARAELARLEPALTFVDGRTAPPDARALSVASDAGGKELALAARSESGRCYYLRISLLAQEFRHWDGDVPCEASDYVDGPHTGWS